MPDINLKSLSKNFKTCFKEMKASEDGKLDKKTFMDKFSNNESIFKMLDKNNDEKISKEELLTLKQADSDKNGVVTENELACIDQIKFFAKRTIDKWFTLDLDRDGHWSNVETKLGEKRMFGSTPDTDTSLDSTMTNEQLAKLYDMKESIDDPNNKKIKEFLEGWTDYLKKIAKDMYGVNLNKKQIDVIKNEYKKQLNTWLFKTGDNKTGDAPLYNSLNLTAYTRLITTEQTVSCCGGDVVPPPASENKNSCSQVFSSLDEEEAQNTATEVKNRLAWAMFKTPPQEELSTDAKLTVWENMTDEQYAKYHEQYQTMRNMKSSDFRELLNPENEQKRIEFEKNSAMSVKQIVDYIDIVESEIGEGNFDSEEWTVNYEQYERITAKINGTFGDEERLNGKTREDIPSNRQALLTFLEQTGLLDKQFKK